MAREQLEIFAAKYQGVWEDDEGVLATPAGQVPTTPECMADPSNRVSQAAMATVQAAAAPSL